MRLVANSLCKLADRTHLLAVRKMQDGRMLASIAREDLTHVDGPYPISPVGVK